MSWTDDRLDDLNAKVDQRFDAVDQRFDRVEQRIDRVEQKVDGLRGEMHAEFRALQRTMLGGFVTLFAAMLGVMATIVTQV